MTPDTELTLDCGRTAGSRQTYTTGNAVYGAAKEFREKLFKFVSENHEIASEDIEWEDGKVFRASGGKRIATNQEVVNLARDQGVDLTHEYNYLCPDTFPPVFDPEAELGIERKDYRNYHSFTFVATVAVVEVREDSGEVDVLKMFSATDCGTAIYPLGIEGQVEGSVVQAMGYALSEEYVVEDGIPKTRTLTQLGIPTIEKAPEIVPLHHRGGRARGALRGQGHRRSIAPARRAGHHQRGARRRRRSRDGPAAQAGQAAGFCSIRRRRRPRKSRPSEHCGNPFWLETH